MARAVLAASERWLDENALAPLRAPGPPSERVRRMIDKLDEFYAGGRQSCLVNMLSSPQTERGPFAEMIEALLRTWISSLAAVIVDAGFDADTASLRAERAIVLVQGSLVVSRGLRTTRPFRTCLASLERTILSPTGSTETA